MQIPNFVLKHSSYAQNAVLDGVNPSRIIRATRITNIRFAQGTEVFYKGAEYPSKIACTPEATYAMNILKGIFIEAFKLRPSLQSFVLLFNRIAFKVLYTHIKKDEYRSPCTLELDRLCTAFLISWGLNRNIASEFGMYFSHIFEFDNAYYLRLVDIMSETSSAQLQKRPYREAKRLALLAFSRELSQRDMRKLLYVYRVACLALLFPKVRRAFRSALRTVDVSKMQYDNADKYWACLREDYNFMGLSNEERKALIVQYGYSTPVLEDFSI